MFLLPAIVYQVIIIHSRKFQSMTTANAYVIVAGEIAESGKIPLPKGSSQIMFEVSFCFNKFEINESFLSLAQLFSITTARGNFYRNLRCESMNLLNTVWYLDCKCKRRFLQESTVYVILYSTLLEHIYIHPKDFESVISVSLALW